jgi:hypothetical protein
MDQQHSGEDGWWLDHPTNPIKSAIKSGKGRENTYTLAARGGQEP